MGHPTHLANATVVKTVPWGKKSLQRLPEIAIKVKLTAQVCLQALPLPTWVFWK